MYRNVILPQSTPAMPPRMPPPRHRHATPSAPWPFVDIDDEVDPARIEDPDSHLPLSAAACDHAQMPRQEVCWCKYPQALYPNWTPRQQKKSKIAKVIATRRHDSCTLYYLDVMEDGIFVNWGEREVNESTQDKQWHTMQEENRPEGVRVRAIFVDGLSGPILQMLGTRYNIEPFFFSSTIGWIPSRHQSNIEPHESDHITITLTFIRSIQNPTTVPPSPSSSYRAASTATRAARLTGLDLMIDTQSPLPLRSSNILLIADHLAVHMIRSRTNSTIISLHARPDHRETAAESLHTRVRATGRSVYWSSIFRDSPDPTFVFLSYLWYALYAWDEVLENLYNHICSLESQVMTTNDMQLTQELHVIRAHILHYQALLKDFGKTVRFVLETPHPSSEPAENSQFDPEEHAMWERSKVMMRRECEKILTEIDRLDKSVKMQDMRVKNVMNLSFSIVTIEDSRQTQKLTEAAVRDSAAIKQISYLTMAFVPSTFVATAFGMNVKEINPESFAKLYQYVAAAVTFTAITVWIIVAYQIQIKEPEPSSASEGETADERSQYTYFAFGGGDGGSDRGRFKHLNLWDRISWPIVLISTMIERRRKLKERRAQTRIDASKLAQLYL